MRQLVVGFDKKVRGVSKRFRKLPTPIQVLIQCWTVLFWAGAFGAIAASLGDWADAMAISFNSFVIGFLLSMYLNLRFRMKALEKTFADGAIKSLLAQLSDGRSIWIRDGQTTYEATPPRKGEKEKAYRLNSH